MSPTPATHRDAHARAAITIGNFDAVHVGHATLLAAARLAVGDNGRVLVLCFDPNPLTVLRPEAAPPRLTTFAQRERFLKSLGAPEVVPLRPTREFLQQSPDQFIEWCATTWHPSAIVEGPDFRFGRARAGSIATLRELEHRFDYRTIVVDPMDVALTDQSLVRASSSLVRWLIAHGRIQDARIVLGRPYEIEATIAPGDKRGRVLGFPTANLSTPEQLLPADGIYAGRAWRDGAGDWPAAISVGSKPTFGGSARTCEAHFLDYDGPVDDYGWQIRLNFTHWLRDQLVFPSVDALVVQMRRDMVHVRSLTRPLSATSGPFKRRSA